MQHGYLFLEQGLEHCLLIGTIATFDNVFVRRNIESLRYHMIQIIHIVCTHIIIICLYRLLFISTININD